MALAVGLVPFTVQYICLRAFYALENTRTPFFLQVVISGANAVLGVALVLVVDEPVAGRHRRSASAYALAYLVGVLRLVPLAARPAARPGRHGPGPALRAAAASPSLPAAVVAG